MGDFRYCSLRIVTDGKEYNYVIGTFFDILKISESDWVKHTSTIKGVGGGYKFIGKTLNLEIKLYPENGRHTLNIIGNSIDYTNDIVEFTVRNDSLHSPFDNSELDKDYVATLVDGYEDTTAYYYRFSDKEVSELIKATYDCKRYDIVGYSEKDMQVMKNMKAMFVYYIMPTINKELPSLMGFFYRNRSL